MKTIKIKEKILGKNDQLARENKKVLQREKVLTINLLGSPGAGKTSLLQKIIDRIKDNYKIAVIEGDLYTARDGKRLESYGIEVVQINTQGACHLDASMVKKALQEINLKEIDLLIIENVGNLVCPASFDLGEDMKITVFSITEGSDKLLKYPLIFARAKAVVINKIDLIAHTDYSASYLHSDLAKINKNLKIFELSSKTGIGVDKFCTYLEEKLR